MLELKNITKEYITKSFRQKALDNVSINFRKSEFTSILGPSGSGKTSLLNIIGGLDRYTSGDLIINEVSTRKYKDKDWDYYRNKRVGFVFQNYNLIMHQTVLKNVELALTLSGTSKRTRIKKAKEALIRVGLKDHINKKPNELSGGQMQRVSIARSLVNNPDILLCDEPTGALDSKTSIDIMNILKEISKDKLVIMVTHNRDLANMYSDRIIELKDGKIIADSNPYNGSINTIKDNKKYKNTSMSLSAAIKLSLNNLMTKKGRTFLTAFAGSIGIIGIALILSLSEGVKKYISNIQKDALSSYPITISKTSFDLESVMKNSYIKKDSIKCKKNEICTKDDISNNSKIKSEVAYKENNLGEFKKYLEDNKNISKYATMIDYNYDINLEVYDNYLKISDNEDKDNNYNTYDDSKTFDKIVYNKELLENKYKLLKGKMPNNYNELVLVVDTDSKVPLSLIYNLNIESKNKLDKIKDDIKNNRKTSINLKNYSYDKLLNKTYKLVLKPDYYEMKGNVWINKENDKNYVNNLIDKSLDLKIVGIIKVKDKDTKSGYLGYDKSLVNYVIEETNKKEIVKQQLENKSLNVFTNESFDNVISSFDINKKILSINDINEPESINIYPKDFKSKKNIEKLIDKYNDIQKKNNKDDNIISYTDMIGILIKSVTSIVDIISYVLIAFVSVSLVVSSIMISIITYISVLERTKEIGILRSIGASKKDIRRVFNAETIIEGFISGTLGVIISIILTKPINLIINNALGVNNLAHLSIKSGIVLIIISILLTLLAGLIPSSKASKKDPVIALRSE